jgi:hypothetical protein
MKVTVWITTEAIKCPCGRAVNGHQEEQRGSIKSQRTQFENAYPTPVEYTFPLKFTIQWDPAD